MSIARPRSLCAAIFALAGIAATAPTAHAKDITWGRTAPAQLKDITWG